MGTCFLIKQNDDRMKRKRREALQNLQTCNFFFLLKNTSLVSLLSVFMGIHFCKAKGPGHMSLTTGQIVDLVLSLL